MDPLWAIPTAVLIVSVTTLALTAIQFLRVLRLDRSTQLQDELKDLRDQLRAALDRLDRVEESERTCQQDRVRLEREKLELLERLVGLKVLPSG